MNTGRVFIESITRKWGMVLQSVHEVSSVALKAFGHIPNRFLFCLVLKMNGRSVNWLLSAAVNLSKLRPWDVHFVS